MVLWLAVVILLYHVTFSSDKSHVVSATHPGMILVWDVATGELQHTLQGGPSPLIGSLAFPTCGNIAIGLMSGKVAGRDDATGKLKYVFNGGQVQDVTSVPFSDDGNRLAAGPSSGYIKIRDGNTGRLLRTIGSYYWPGVTSNLSFDTTSSYLLTGSHAIRDPPSSHPYSGATIPWIYSGF